MKWRTQTESPMDTVSALIVLTDSDDGMRFLDADLWTWNGDVWTNQRSGHHLEVTEYWWLDERELLSTLTPQAFSDSPPNLVAIDGPHCDTCGNWSSQLVQGMCPACINKYQPAEITHEHA